MEIILALFVLMLVAIGTFFLAKRFRMPYTVLLVIVGSILVPVAHLPALHFLRSFTLTPDLLFYIFLPVLIFESAYNMNVRELQENIRAVSWLSIVSLLISTAFVGVALYYVLAWIGFPVPLIVALVFGALISATDPVAVLSLFKEYGAPKRLAFLFEGESLFNDGTSLAVFLILMEVMLHGYAGMSSFAEGVFSFGTMVVGGTAFGIAMGFLFAKLIEKARGNDAVELTLTLLVAHLTFILSELISEHLVVAGHEIKLSAIIATVLASMVIGNYGRFKISPKVEASMQQFWGYFAFIANSLVFLLMGLLFAGLSIDFWFFVVPVVVTVVIVMMGRALSVYPVVGLLNRMGHEQHIPRSWQHLLAWGSLRGALAVTMVLLIPDDATVVGWEYDFTIKEFFAALTIGCVYFTLLVKATTIGVIMKRLHVGDLTPLESVEHESGRMIIARAAEERLERFQEKGYVPASLKDKLMREYDSEECAARDRCGDMLATDGRILAESLHLHAIGIERRYLRQLFAYDEVSEAVCKRIANKLTIQMARIEEGHETTHTPGETYPLDWFERLAASGRRLLGPSARSRRSSIEEQYAYYRAQAIIARKVDKHLGLLAEQGGSFFAEHADAVAGVREHYRAFQQGAAAKADAIFAQHENMLRAADERFARSALFRVEESVLEEFVASDAFSPKVAILLADELAARKERVVA